MQKKILKNEYLVAKIGFDTAENEPCKVCPLSVYRTKSGSSSSLLLLQMPQVEYAAKAVENSGTVVGLCCKDGVVMGCEKFLTSKMLVPGTNRRILRVAKHAGIAMAGLVPWVANKRFEISKFKLKFPRARAYEVIGLVLGCIETKFCK